MLNGRDVLGINNLCIVFIDGGYLKAILKKYDFPVDYVKLSENIAREIRSERLRTYYYDCLPILVEGNDKSKLHYGNKQKFLDKLSQLPRFEIKLGKLQKIGGSYSQKKVDVLMSLDIAKNCFEKHVQHVVLIAGDSDFVPSVEEAKDYGVVVHLFADRGSLNKELLEKVDEFHPLDKKFLENCKLIGNENS